ncbi:hypothetical protein FACS189425_00420 [Clostridia bacterium]|nr:hypothetical protein FACS189425_00420 [Clostridia bacterium]
MTKTGFLAIVLGLVYTLAIGFICYQMGTLNPRTALIAEANTPPPIETPSTPTPTPSTTPSEIIYTIKEYNSRIGVYENDELIRIVDIDVSSLRVQDVTRLKNGIKAKSKEEVASILEDYSS